MMPSILPNQFKPESEPENVYEQEEGEEVGVLELGWKKQYLFDTLLKQLFCFAFSSTAQPGLGSLYLYLNHILWLHHVHNRNELHHSIQTSQYPEKACCSPNEPLFLCNFVTLQMFLCSNSNFKH